MEQLILTMIDHVKHVSKRKASFIRILDRARLHLDNIPSLDKVNFTFPNENGDNKEENLDEDLPTFY